MNSILKKLLISLSITALISVGLGYALAPLLGTWLNAFIFSFILQVVGNFYYSDYKIRQIGRETEALYNERLDILSRNLVKFECPCGNNQFEEIIYVGQDNTFTCDKCDQTIRADINIVPVIITAPLAEDPLQKIQKMVDR